MINIGDLVHIVPAKDQNQGFMKNLWGHIGLITAKVDSSTSKYLWAIYIFSKDKTYTLHELDFEQWKE
jgi:hypothetical protein